jgi:hypothetical protein
MVHSLLTVTGRRINDSLDESSLPKLLANGRPLVFAFEKFLPVVFRLLPRNKFPERGEQASQVKALGNYRATHTIHQIPTGENCNPRGFQLN